MGESWEEEGKGNGEEERKKEEKDDRGESLMGVRYKRRKKKTSKGKVKRSEE